MDEYLRNKQFFNVVSRACWVDFFKYIKKKLQPLANRTFCLFGVFDAVCDCRHLSVFIKNDLAEFCSFPQGYFWFRSRQYTPDGNLFKLDKNLNKTDPGKNRGFISVVFRLLAWIWTLLECKNKSFFPVMANKRHQHLFCRHFFLFADQKKALFCLMILGFVVLSSWSVLPVSRGLGFITDKKLYHAVKKIVSQDPSRKWIVYGSDLHSGFITTTGANVFNGTKYAPNISAMKILDPSGNNNDIYNRYANIVIGNRPEIDRVGFQLFYEDNYGITISPFSKKLIDLEITYLLMPAYQNYYNIEEGKQKGVFPVYDRPVDNFWILKIANNDSALGKGSFRDNR
jgi:hypothetical protein